MKVHIVLDDGTTFRTIDSKDFKIWSQLPGHANTEQNRMFLEIGKAVASAAQEERPEKKRK
jgi:hypothetical protein